MIWNYFSILQSIRKMPMQIEWLKICASCSEIYRFSNSRTFTGMLKGPVDLPFCKQEIISSISV